MTTASRKLVLLGYVCAVLALLVGGDGVEVYIAIVLGVAGVGIGIAAGSGGRRINGTVIVILSVIFAYLGATGFRQGFVGGFARTYQAAHQQGQ